MRIRKSIAAISILGSVFAGSVATGGTATAAATSACTNGPVGNYSDAVFKLSSGTGSLKSGPANECSSVASAPYGTIFYAWCQKINDYGNYWVYGRIAGTQTKGWYYTSNLKQQSGNLYMC
ncbi:hypothetical protein ACFV3R_14240 [Streptomyces sp. NPDC059740]|uniref:hypothetical protein n=1 Tax=Streptomyces sp. NPDC059740 TaxID=3346926 RepID=UPI0036472EEE